VAFSVVLLLLNVLSDFGDGFNGRSSLVLTFSVGLCLSIRTAIVLESLDEY
jgi:hypothetical protein